MAKIGVILMLAIAAFAQQNTLQSKILAKERQGLDCLKTGNLAEFAALTADDAVFVDAHGPASKAEVVKKHVGVPTRRLHHRRCEIRAAVLQIRPDYLQTHGIRYVPRKTI
jgi:hypothetical protein